MTPRLELKTGELRLPTFLPDATRGFLEVDLNLCMACLACETTCPLDCLIVGRISRIGYYDTFPGIDQHHNAQKESFLSAIGYQYLAVCIDTHLFLILKFLSYSRAKTKKAASGRG